MSLAGLDGSAPSVTGKEVSVTEAGKRPVGRRRKGPPVTGQGALRLPYLSQRASSLPCEMFTFFSYYNRK